MMVIVSHVELFKDYHGFPNAYASNTAMYELGRMGVTLFFVLSGFLISYLLLEEKRTAGTISIGRFYVRRILRIWPLYYLIVIVTFLVLPNLGLFSIPKYSALVPESFRYTFPLYLFLLPQLALSVFPPVPYAEPLWSIGVEEQFYLLWPLLMKGFRNVLALCVVTIVAVIVLQQAAFLVAEANRGDPSLEYWNYLLSYLYFNRVDCMAIGGIGAWLVFERRKTLLAVVFSRPFQVALYALTAFVLATERDGPVYSYAPYAVLFCLIIMNLAANPATLVRIENRTFVFLGKISFAMYMLHEIAIKLTLEGLVRGLGTTFASPASNVLLYTFSIVLTLALSALVYRYFETPFLRLKPRYTVLRTGEAMTR